MKRKLLFVIFGTINILNTVYCQNTEDTHLDRLEHYNEKYKDNFKYSDEEIEYFDNVIIENVSYPSFYCGNLATAVEISVINSRNEREKYYTFYLMALERAIRETFIIGKKYIFYYDILEKNCFSILAGEEHINIENGNTKWVKKMFRNIKTYLCFSAYFLFRRS